MTKIFARTLKLTDLIAKKSFFLFGPRGTGKSFLIRHSLTQSTFTVNLLRTSLQLRLLQDPSALAEMIAEQAPDPETVIVIDEIQKIPLLLDEVHRLIEEEGRRFLLTGSSARKLKAAGVNLLAGRAWIAHLFPLTFAEIPQFDLSRYLRYGGLPSVILSDSPEEELDAYIQTYINEEIKSEGAVRKIPAFVEFLRLAALSNAEQINFTKIAQDVGVSPPTIASYFQILEDTLIGFQVRPWQKSTSRKAVSTSKFYFFDTGVVNTLAGIEHIDRHSNLYGNLFEHWVALELRAFISYTRTKASLEFWRTEDKIEVDFVIDRHIAVEVKATRKVTSSDLKGLRALRSEDPHLTLYLVSDDPLDRHHEGIHLLHWKSFITRLWANQLEGLLNTGG